MGAVHLPSLFLPPFIQSCGEMTNKHVLRAVTDRRNVAAFSVRAGWSRRSTCLIPVFLTTASCVRKRLAAFLMTCLLHRKPMAGVWWVVALVEPCCCTLVSKLYPLCPNLSYTSKPRYATKGDDKVP